MKVLFINTVFEKGSTGRIVKDLGTAVEENGGEYRAVYGRGFSDDPHAIKMTSNVEVVSHALLSRITDRAGFYSKRSTKHLVEYIKKYKPDIIHLHNLHGYYLNIEILFHYLKTEYEGKIIWTLHDCWAFTGHCTHYTEKGCYKWKNECANCPQKREYPSSLLKDNSRRNYLLKKQLFTSLDNITIIAVSDWLASQVKESFFKTYPIVRIYNGIDHDIFKNIKNDIKKQLGIEDKKVILCVSDGWNQRKGINDILKWATIMPDTVRFILVGLEKKQIKLLPNNIIGLEKTRNIEKLVQLYSCADLFFNPSREETFGMVTAEAMACGVPVLAYNVTACAELVDANSGIIVEDFSDILECNIDKIIFDKNKIVASSMRFDKKKVIEEIYNLYKEDLNES